MPPRIWSWPEAPRAGFEPAAYSLGGSRSIRLSYRGGSAGGYAARVRTHPCDLHTLRYAGSHELRWRPSRVSRLQGEFSGVALGERAARGAFKSRQRALGARVVGGNSTGYCSTEPRG